MSNISSLFFKSSIDQEFTILRWSSSGQFGAGWYVFTSFPGSTEFIQGEYLENTSQSDTYLFDSAIDQNLANVAGGAGIDAYIFSKQLSYSVHIIDDDDHTDDLVRFIDGFVATSFVLATDVDGVVSTLTINFDNSDGVAQTIKIDTPTDFKFQISNGAQLTFAEFATQSRIDNGFSANRFPTVVNDAATTATATEEQPFSIDVSSFFTDPDGNPLSFRLLPNAPSWSAIASDTGLITGTPTEHDIGEHELTIIAYDGQGGYVTHTLYVNVANVDSPPVFLKNTYTTSITERVRTAESLVSLEVENVDQDVLTYTTTSAIAYMVEDNVTSILNPAVRGFSVNAAGELSYSGSGLDADRGVDHIVLNVKVEDGYGGEDTATITVNNVNEAPTIEVINIESGQNLDDFTLTHNQVGQRISDLEVRVNDPENGDFTINSDDGAGTIWITDDGDNFISTVFELVANDDGTYGVQLKPEQFLHVGSDVGFTIHVRDTLVDEHATPVTSTLITVAVSNAESSGGDRFNIDDFDLDGVDLFHDNMDQMMVDII